MQLSMAEKAWAVTQLKEPALMLHSVEAFTTIWVTSLGVFGGLLALAGAGHLADAVASLLLRAPRPF
ncbi:hypothetical protein [Cryobacterium psychrophilum]|uniref:Uncharacterized protein n=1 Tax=Cryobacterium psychrophilum TaxID=41988 RepID=A0A4Y8KRX4_9MICO|nr:hypothetical protein [Cryobacterium psychrophilum]TFD82364.1 hypothetical protein E3T53_00340 [Cryobacterium psychrophilum]